MRRIASKWLQGWVPRKPLNSLTLLVAMAAAGVSAAHADAPVVHVAAVGGLALSGVWPRLAAQAGMDLGLSVRTVALAPKEGVVPAFIQGQAEVLLIHASDEAMSLQAAGYAAAVRVWAWNEHVIVGPAADPANVRQARDGQEAMQRISQAKTPFIAFRDPGSYSITQRLWRRTGIRPGADWVRVDMSPTPQAVLQEASAAQAYVVVGNIPVAFGKMPSPHSTVLLKGDPMMRRPYVVLTPGPRHPAEKEARLLAAKLADFLVSPAGQKALTEADREAGGPWLFPIDSVPPNFAEGAQ